MSKQTILRLVSRLENIADALYGSSYEEICSLGGQAEGTIYSINDEFRSHGISPRIEELASLGYQEFDQGNVDQLARIFHHVAARFRGMAERL